MIKLKPYQQKVYNEFIKCLDNSKTFNNLHLIIDAPRRSGKTILLQFIIENTKRTFWILTPNYRMFKLFYGQYKNCYYYKENKNNIIHHTDIFIGDEMIIPEGAINNFICAGTFGMDKENVIRWNNTFDKKTLKQILVLHKDMAKDIWDKEFGSYLS